VAEQARNPHERGGDDNVRQPACVDKGGDGQQFGRQRDALPEPADVCDERRGGEEPEHQPRVVFDRLVQQLARDEVVLDVRGKPVLVDVERGMPEVAREARQPD
jgi:hypothetical protein